MNHIDLMEGLNINQNCTGTRQETRASLRRRAPALGILEQEQAILYGKYLQTNKI
jgi:hypothetical protein